MIYGILQCSFMKTIRIRPRPPYLYRPTDSLGFERWKSANKGLPLVSVKDHLGSIGGVEAREWRSCVMESVHLTLGRPLDLFQQ